MNKKIIPMGYSNFKKVIDNNAYYVDKTKIIEDLLTTKAEVTLFTRPRRFGKSLLLSTLYYFFDIENKDNNKYLFEGLNISKTEYMKYFGEFPVIRVDFKELKQDTYTSVYNSYKGLIASLYDKYIYILDSLEKHKKDMFLRFLNKVAYEEEYKTALYILSELLYKYYNKKVIILIDEYDVPIQQGYLKGFYDEIVGLIRNLFSSSLKGNDYVEMSILTGVLRVSKESLFSDVNNIKVDTVVDQRYNKYFGFTSDETKALLKYYGLKLTSVVKDMYDGYNFGGKYIYNPWSVINYVDNRMLIPYWVNTSGNELIKDIMYNTSDNIKISIEKLLQNQEIDILYMPKVTYLDINNTESEIIVFNFLLTSGYLTISPTVESVIENKITKVVIPNEEVKQVFSTILTEEIINKKNINLDKILKFNSAIINNDKTTSEKILNTILPSMSFMDETESFYHGFIFGLFSTFLDDKYIIKSNREAGDGRFDLMIESSDRKNGYIIEFKIAKDEDMEQSAMNAIEQMKKKEYYRELELDKVKNIYEYAIIFKGKHAIVR